MNENKNLPVLGGVNVFIPIKEKFFKGLIIIKKIEFLDIIPDLDDVQNKWDVSDKQDGSVMAWLDGDILKISGNGPIETAMDCCAFFTYLSKVLNVEYNDLVDISEIEYAKEILFSLGYRILSIYYSDIREQIKFIYPLCNYEGEDTFEDCNHKIISIESFRRNEKIFGSLWIYETNCDGTDYKDSTLNEKELFAVSQYCASLGWFNDLV